MTSARIVDAMRKCASEKAVFDSAQPALFPSRVPEGKHLQVVCALIERGGRVLVAQRSRAKAQGGKWEFPGGKLHEGESPQDALAREIREELGIAIRVCSPLSASTHDYGDFSITLLPFLCMIEAGEPAATEHEAIAWCTPDQLDSVDWAEADVPVFEEYVRELNRRSAKR